MFGSNRACARRVKRTVGARRAKKRDLLTVSRQRALQPPVCFVPLRLTVDASGRIRQRLEPLGGDFPRAVLAHSVAAFRGSSPCVLRLDRILVENAMDRVGGGSGFFDLSLVRSPESFTHELPPPSIVLRCRR